MPGLSKMKFYKDRDGEWRWQLKASNGRIIAASTEGYVRRTDAVNNARTVANQAYSAYHRRIFET